ncbi:MAG: sigma-54 factor interaction domain-containing protein [Halanaerobiales bacterium]|nr:sigma-54 factor interaction domain-containing protein [Halanaerobiales bacterium]
MLKEIIVNCNIFDNSNVIKYREIGLHVGKNRIECSLKISPVVKNNHHLGVVLVARKLDSIRSDVTKIAGYSSTYTFDNIITKNHNMLSLINTAKKIAMNDCPVLIQGESGTGKELFAHSLHNASPRHKGPFIAINCAALPKDLVESELFGYERGAFTGAAKEGNPGKFELANRGTIFLDEIGELPLDIQAKLLRVLDNYEITRLGGKNKRKLDIRIITATNRNLSEEVLIKNFRQDLFYD